LYRIAPTTLVCLLLFSSCSGFLGRFGLSGRSGSEHGSPAAMSKIAPATPEGFRLGPGDVLSSRVFREPELTGDYMVEVDGSLQFPLAGQVVAAGLTATEVASGLTTALAGQYLSNPQVPVLVKSANSRKVSVLGQVEKPGTFRYQDQLTLVEAITLAGGLSKIAEASRVKVTRVRDGKEHHFVISLDRILDGRAPNLPLQAGDVVFVPESLF